MTEPEPHPILPLMQLAIESESRIGMGGHQSARMEKDEWLTPPRILKALGVFDLDPCAPVKRPWEMARRHFTVQDNGLIREWEGRVFLNPPYGNETAKWLARLAEHGNGIALIFARTETKDWWTWVWCAADAILFLKGRLFFHHVDGRPAAANSGAPSTLIAYGEQNVTALQQCGLEGALVVDWNQSKDL